MWFCAVCVGNSRCVIGLQSPPQAQTIPSRPIGHPYLRSLAHEYHDTSYISYLSSFLARALHLNLSSLLLPRFIPRTQSQITLDSLVVLSTNLWTIMTSEGSFDDDATARWAPVVGVEVSISGSEVIRSRVLVPIRLRIYSRQQPFSTRPYLIGVRLARSELTIIPTRPCPRNSYLGGPCDAVPFCLSTVPVV